MLYLLALILILTGYCAYTDYQNYRIPNAATVPVLLGGLIYQATLGNGINYGLKGLLIGGCIFLIAITTGQIGEGDGKLLMAIGAWTGWTAVVLILWVSFVIGGIWKLTLLARNIKKPLPFGVCIFGGAVVLVLLYILLAR